jgi:uncharacterized protein
MSFEELANEFLAQKSIAVVGLSRSKPLPGNGIYKMLKDKGYSVYPVHPDAESIEGDICYPNLQSIPEKVDGVFVVARPEITEQIVRDAVKAHIPRVWMHYNAFFGESNSSISKTAVAYGREKGLSIIEGGCPMMFFEFSHKCMRWMLGVTGQLPK